ncbi:MULTISPECIES: cation:proton antiporter [Dehalococcoides]|uniref:cation:proton antiporter n=1 Tax=Dehalococcoides TaxID=61434 RepID=UPI0003C81F44|nr:MULTISPECIES: cation:proton antiporter [Dehalococcoides]AHB14290.1 monovalent cation:H+ antiporter-2, CPA2 family [Dehalococcoides mccartyi GY50]AII58627.1 sodium/hydrogen exchanger [Dehalococcoides mccartyi CG1]APH11742.1 sodium:proton exchanger [Dehalococcoides mccartyi]UJP38232.1 cation:proton antiporter [Dehalococcoides mccartyi]BAQ35453.1 putative transport protein [Dehalococcoides sp. UCH007]
MEELGSSFGLDLIIVLIAAVLAGLLARRFKLPLLLGYLGAGIAIGPNGFGLVQSPGVIESMATVGVILLLFTLGLDFSLDELKRVGKVAVLGGLIQIIVTAGFGFLLGRGLGWDINASIFFGFMVSLSSTLIVLKILMDRGEAEAPHGRVMLGILLVQDICLIPLMIILPALGSEGGDVGLTIGVAFAKAAAFILVMFALGFWVFPRLLGRVAAHSHELFLLSVITLSLGAAMGATALGLSPAVGAFIAGLLIGQSMYAKQALADIIPLRDIFGALFFVSLGMLANLNFAVENMGLVLLVVVFLLVIKSLVAGVVPWLFGYTFQTSFTTGIGLMQIGEFSFVLAGVGLASSVISDSIYAITISSAVITMIITPFALSFSGAAYRKVSQWPLASKLVSLRTSGQAEFMDLDISNHAVICSQGGVAKTLTRVMNRRNFPFLVIDLDPQTIAELRRQKAPAIYGDAANPEILRFARLEKARLLICAMPGFADTEQVVKNARKINARLDIVARVTSDTQAAKLKQMGVSEVVQPEFEVGLELSRHAMHRFGMTTIEIQYILNSLRNMGKNE